MLVMLLVITGVIFIVVIGVMFLMIIVTILMIIGLIQRLLNNKFLNIPLPIIK